VQAGLQLQQYNSNQWCVENNGGWVTAAAKLRRLYSDLSMIVLGFANIDFCDNMLAAAILTPYGALGCFTSSALAK
jgi:hypothetical protein